MCGITFLWRPCNWKLNQTAAAENRVGLGKTVKIHGKPNFSMFRGKRQQWGQPKGKVWRFYLFRGGVIRYPSAATASGSSETNEDAGFDFLSPSISLSV